MAGRFSLFFRYTFGKDYLPQETTKFVIVALSRTGSNLLAGMLDSHPEVLCHHEMFNPTGIHRSLRYKGSDLTFGTVEERNRDPWAFAAKVFAYSGGAKAVGFKMGSRQNDGFLVSTLLNRNIRKIILRRRQWLEQFVSQRVAEKTNVWSNMPAFASTETSARQPVRIRVDTKDLLRFIRKREMFYHGVEFLTSMTRQPVIHVAYEDLGDGSIMRDILEFLEVNPNIDLEKKTRKQATASLADRVENYAELQKSLQGTRHANLV